MSSFDTVAEVILYVQNMDRMLSFYTDVLGIDVAGGAPEHGFVRLDTQGTDLCLHRGAEEPPGPFSPTIVFGVDDAEAARSYLLERDVDVSEIRSPAPGTSVIDARDPEGNELSFESS